MESCQVRYEYEYACIQYLPVFHGSHSHFRERLNLKGYNVKRYSAPDFVHKTSTYTGARFGSAKFHVREDTEFDCKVQNLRVRVVNEHADTEL